MALPSSGAISLSQVNVELGVSATATRSLNDATTRTLFGVASGAISMSNGYGKANEFAFTIASNQTNANLRTLAVNAGWNQSTKVVATINSGVVVSSNSTATPALTISGSFPNGVQLVNNGYIIGMGGKGGNNYNTSGAGGTAGAAGGLALSTSVAVSINNAGTIAGGGGGGGCGRSLKHYLYNSYGGYVYDERYGGTGGGGRTGSTNSAAGTVTAGGSGRAGTAGTFSAVGSGGIGDGQGQARQGGNGGAGGGWGSAGSSGTAPSAGDSGNWGPTAGGAAGAAVSGNANITWVATGTRLGAIA